MSKRDGPPQTNPILVGPTHSDPDQIGPTPPPQQQQQHQQLQLQQLHHHQQQQQQQQQAQFLQPNIYMSGPHVVQAQHHMPLQHQNQPQQFALHQHQQPIWPVDVREAYPQFEPVPASGPSFNEAISLTTYVDPMNDPSRASNSSQPNYQHVQEPMKSSFSYPSQPHEEPSKQHRQSSGSVVPVPFIPSTNANVTSSYTELQNGSNFSLPTTTPLNSVPMGPGNLHPPPPFLPQTQQQHHQQLLIQYQQHLQYLQQQQQQQYPQAVLPPGMMRVPSYNQFPQTQHPLPSPSQQQQFPQQAQQMLPMFPPQQKPQARFFQPGVTTHHPLPPQFTHENGANSASFSAPFPQQPFGTDKKVDSLSAPRSRSTPSHHPSFEGYQDSSVLQASLEQPGPFFSTNPNSSNVIPFTYGVFPGTAPGAPPALPEGYYPPAPLLQDPDFPPIAERQSKRLSSTSSSQSTKKAKLDSKKSKPKAAKNSKTRKSSADSDEDDDTPELPNRRHYKNRQLRCFVCGRGISRDMTRHMRIHEDVSRFSCIFPREFCSHKTGYFNRQYDFKKHLLHYHFQFEDTTAKRYNSLNEKLPFKGSCYCGVTMLASDWLSSHILVKDANRDYTCPHLKAKWDEHKSNEGKLEYSSNVDGTEAHSGDSPSPSEPGSHHSNSPRDPTPKDQ